MRKQRLRGSERALVHRMKIPIDWPLLLARPPALPLPSSTPPLLLETSRDTYRAAHPLARRRPRWRKGLSSGKGGGIFERACTLGKDMDRDGMKGEIIEWRDCEHYVAGLEEKGPSFGLTD